MLCCNRSNDNDEFKEYSDTEVEAIYNAILEGNTYIKEEEELQDSEDQNEEDDAGDDLTEKQLDAFTELKRFIKKHRTNAVDISDRLRKFRRKNDDSFDTLLHSAALFNKDPRIVYLLTKYCPDLITLPRTGSYKGQTALHITIAKGKTEATQVILENLKDQHILKHRATGSKFKSNIMMGETVLSVAVLTFNTELVDLLLEYGAPIEQVNTKGNTVIHTLIKYAKIRPDKSSEVITMLKFLNQKIIKPKKHIKNARITPGVSLKIEDRDGKEKQEKLNKDAEDLIEKMWFKENNKLLTPLKLVVSSGLIEIFQAMMKLKNVFYFPSNHDGFYDTRYYDITEIDDVAQYEYTNYKKQNTLKSGVVRQTCNRLFGYKRPESFVETLSAIEWKKAQPFVDTAQIKMIISNRWATHRIPLFFFLFVHLSVMFFFTTSIYYRKNVVTECNSSKNDCQTAEMYAKVTPWILVAYSTVVIIAEIYRWAVLRQKWRPDKHHNNSWYRISLLLFALGLFVDAILFTCYEDINGIVVIILILGSWFLFFFLKSYEKFSVYTVLFQKVIMGDLIRFGLIIGIEFTAYTFAMYIALKGNGDVAEFLTFENITLNMFNYMLGLNDLSILEKVESIDTQRLVTFIYVLFIISTYILLINSLIAMMNGTSTYVFEDRKALNVLQRSSVIMFLDGFLFIPKLKRRLIDDKPNLGSFRKHRFYLAIKTDQIGEIIREKRERKSFTLRDLLKRNNFPKAKPDVVNAVKGLGNTLPNSGTIADKDLNVLVNLRATPVERLDIYDDTQ